MSTSKLQRYTSRELSKYLSEFEIYENSRPDWLHGKELDFFIPKIDTAMEVQGNQHYCFTSIFHKTIADFVALQKRDIDKKNECADNGIKLYEICSEIDADILIIDLFYKYCKHRDEPKFLYCSPIDRRTKLLHRKIIKNKPEAHINRLMIRLAKIANRLNINIDDPIIIDYYDKHREQIEKRINGIFE